MHLKLAVTVGAAVAPGGNWLIPSAAARIQPKIEVGGSMNFLRRNSYTKSTSKRSGLVELIKRFL
jgi:hypothetical protein